MDLKWRRNDCRFTIHNWLDHIHKDTLRLHYFLQNTSTHDCLTAAYHAVISGIRFVADVSATDLRQTVALSHDSAVLKKTLQATLHFWHVFKNNKKRGILNVLLKEKYMLIINQWLSTHTTRLTENTCMSATHLWPHTPQPHQKCIFNNWHLKAHKSSLLSITRKQMCSALVWNYAELILLLLEE